MRVALVHVGTEAWITRVDTVLPGSTMQLTRSSEEAGRELRKEGYAKVCGFQGDGRQLLVFIEEHLMYRPVFIAAALIERMLGAEDPTLWPGSEDPSQ